MWIIALMYSCKTRIWVYYLNMVERKETPDFNVVRAVRKIPAPTREESQLWIESVSEAMKKPEADQFFNYLHESTNSAPDDIQESAEHSPALHIEPGTIRAVRNTCNDPATWKGKSTAEIVSNLLSNSTLVVPGLADDKGWD